LAAAAALLATGLMYLLLLTTPRPWRFFMWIISLATLAVAVAPLVTEEDAATRIATAAIHLASDDRRTNRSVQIRSLLQELVAAVDAKNAALPPSPGECPDRSRAVRRRGTGDLQ
jgi:hypothetical protein